MNGTATELGNFAIVLDHPDEECWRTVQRLWPESSYVHTDRVIYLRLPISTLTSKIANQVGMDRSRKVNGVVIRMGSYYGWNDRALWEWLGFVNE